MTNQVKHTTDTDKKDRGEAVAERLRELLALKNIELTSMMLTRQEVEDLIAKLDADNAQICDLIDKNYQLETQVDWLESDLVQKENDLRWRSSDDCLL